MLRDSFERHLKTVNMDISISDVLNYNGSVLTVPIFGGSDSYSILLSF
jgi:hypothetical protein